MYVARHVRPARTLLSLAAFGLFAAVPCRAANPGDLVPVFLGNTQSLSDTIFNYNVVFTPSSVGDSLATGDFITFYDVNQLSGAGADVGFTGNSTNLGQTPPGVSVTDSPSIPNITYTYSGPTVTTTTTFLHFQLFSHSNAIGMEQFADRYHVSGAVTGGQGLVLGPVAPTPEPSSVAAFGFTALGVVGLMLKARKRKTGVTPSA